MGKNPDYIANITLENTRIKHFCHQMEPVLSLVICHILECGATAGPLLMWGRLTDDTLSD